MKTLLLIAAAYIGYKIFLAPKDANAEGLPDEKPPYGLRGPGLTIWITGYNNGLRGLELSAWLESKLAEQVYSPADVPTGNLGPPAIRTDIPVPDYREFWIMENQ